MIDAVTERLPIPDATLVKWRRIVTILADIASAPSALMMKAEPPDPHLSVANEHPESPCEVEVAQLVMLGRSAKEIADALARETGAIDFHRNNIRNKLGLRSQGVTLRSHLSLLRESLVWR